MSGTTTAISRKHSLLTNTLLVWAGGYLDGFTFFGHGHVFANAMTANVVLFGYEVCANPLHSKFEHFYPIVMFCLGVWAARAFRHEAVRKALRHPDVIVLVIEIFILLILAMLPAHTANLVFTIPIVFVASLQLRTFAMVHSHPYASTFTTGNLVSLSEGLFDWIYTDRSEQGRQKSKVFLCICGSFLAGAAAGCFGVVRLGNRALFVEVLVLALAAPLIPGES